MSLNMFKSSTLIYLRYQKYYTGIPVLRASYMTIIFTCLFFKIFKTLTGNKTWWTELS